MPINRLFVPSKCQGTLISGSYQSDKDLAFGLGERIWNRAMRANRKCQCSDIRNICVGVYVYMCVYTRVYVFMCARVYVSVYKYIYACMCVYVCVCIFVYICVCIYIYICE